VLRRIDFRGLSGPPGEALPRPRLPGDGPVTEVREILELVRQGGDAALLELTARFDGVRLESLTVAPAEILAAVDRIAPPVLRALENAAANIRLYHEAQLPGEVNVEREGIRITGLHRPVRRAGCYVPGGRAAYPSTVLMTAIPARVAGVAEVAVTVPPGPDGSVPDVTLAAAAVAGVTEVHPVGGAQAIGALAYGTASVAAVDVIVGPGNSYVAVAKQEVAGLVGVPSAFTGPSEVVVVADDSVGPELAAIDLIVQAEHGPDGLCWLVTWDQGVLDRVDEEVEALVAVAARRSDIERTLATAGYAVLCESPEQAMEVVNSIAPEHLELLTRSPDDLVPLVRNAGAVFCGPWSPASIGDYLAGPSHVLPTNGSARFASALTVRDFMKDIHVVSVDEAGLAGMADDVVALAEAEGLTAHADSIRMRWRVPVR
jgi:histidinol dehydrogenase